MPRLMSGWLKVDCRAITTQITGHGGDGACGTLARGRHIRRQSRAQNQSKRQEPLFPREPLHEGLFLSLVIFDDLDCRVSAPRAFKDAPVVIEAPLDTNEAHVSVADAARMGDHPQLRKYFIPSHVSLLSLFRCLPSRPRSTIKKDIGGTSATHPSSTQFIHRRRFSPCVT